MFYRWNRAFIVFIKNSCRGKRMPRSACQVWYKFSNCTESLNNWLLICDKESDHSISYCVKDYMLCNHWVCWKSVADDHFTAAHCSQAREFHIQWHLSAGKITETLSSFISSYSSVFLINMNKLLEEKYERYRVGLQDPDVSVIQSTEEKIINSANDDSIKKLEDRKEKIWSLFCFKIVSKASKKIIFDF